MYEAFFHFQRRPFAATPDPECIFETHALRELLAELQICIEQARGIGVLTAAAGMGKTLICQTLVQQFQDGFKTVLLRNSNFPTRRSLLQSLLFELDQPYSGRGEQELRLDLIRHGKAILNDYQGVALVIDEAHLLSDRLLEEVRSVTNLSEGGVPLFRVVLCGQPVLEEKLATPALELLNQRVGSQVYLETLTRDESAQYIQHRISWAGGELNHIFTPEAVQFICHAADGLPRCINQLCDHCLLLAFVAEIKQVDMEVAIEALGDLKRLPLHWNEPTAVATPLDALRARATECLDETASEQEESSTFDGSVNPESIESFDESYDETEIETIEIGAEGDEAESVAATFDEIGAGAVSSFEFGAEDEDAIAADEGLETETETETEAVPSGTDQPYDEPPVIARPVLGVVPLLSDHHSGTLLFEEEIVVDPYATLDAGLSHIPAANVPPQSTEAHDRLSIPLQNHGDDQMEQADRSTQQSAQRIDEAAVPAVDSEMIASVPFDPIAGSVISTTDVNADSEVTAFAQSDDNDDNIEEQISEEVQEICQETQQSIIGRTEAALSQGSPEGAEGTLAEPQWFPGMDDAREMQFDVVQPELDEVSAEAQTVPRQPAARYDAPVEQASGTVPRPNVRRLFSRLRRAQHEKLERQF